MDGFQKAIGLMPRWDGIGSIQFNKIENLKMDIYRIPISFQLKIFKKKLIVSIYRD